MTDKRVERNKKNIENIKKLLLSICENVNKFLDDEALTKALYSQGALAKYNNTEYDIIKSSLNTLKRTSEKLYPNGFHEIDKLRVLALGEINKELNIHSSSPSTKEHYKAKYEASQLDLDRQREVNLVAINQIMSEIQLLKSLKKIDNIDLVHDLCEKQILKLQSVALDYTDFSIFKSDPELKLVKDTPNE